MFHNIVARLPSRCASLSALVAVLPLAGLFAISQCHFLLFHCLTEAFSIVVATAAFMVLWNTRQYVSNGFFLVIGIGCLFAGFLDLVYIFGYKGMGMLALPGADGNVALQAKTVAQCYVSLSCLAAFRFSRRQLHHTAALMLYATLLVLALASILYWRVFPDCLAEDGRTTGFYRFGLVVSSIAYLIGLVLLLRSRRDFDPYLFRIFAAAGTALFIEDFTAAVASDPAGPVRIVAHLCQVVALYFVYKAFIEVGLRRPYDLLFHSLKQSEESLAQYAAVLEANNKALNELHGAAEVASKMKGEFLANMSHEIRTPMTAILGFADVLSERLHQPEDIEAIDTIRRNGQYLLRLIDDVLDLSKIEAGRFVVERAACSPAGIVSEVVSLMQARASSKGLLLEMQFDGPVPGSVETDPLRVRQVLLNLVGNAIKFTEAGSVRVVCRFLEEGGQCIMQFKVVDTGIGMTEDQSARLFEPFVQADTSTTRRFGGTGLGLAISRRLARMLGGDVEVRSVHGKGSVFTLTIAVRPLAGACPIAQAGPTQVETGPATPSRGDSAPRLACRLLLAEDGPDNQRLIAHLLRKAGAEVTVVENGQLALDAVRAAQEEGRPFDMVLLDMQMPVMDGYEAARRLRAEGHQQPIVALTAHAMTGDREKCLDAGCDDYVTKPITASLFLERVAGHVGRNAAG